MKYLPGKVHEQILQNALQEPNQQPFIFYQKYINKVTLVNTITAGVSGYLDNVLKPYATNAPSYLRDTTDFLRILQATQNLPYNTILATMDVEALYTNIPHKDGLQAITNAIQNKEESNIITTLCDFGLTNSYFSFANKNYLQINGTVMSTHMAPQYSDIFMADLEHFLNHCTQKPLLYLRYIDDIFLLWTHGEESLKNSTRTSIVFTQTSASPWNNPHNRILLVRQYASPTRSLATLALPPLTAEHLLTVWEESPLDLLDRMASCCRRWGSASQAPGPIGMLPKKKCPALCQESGPGRLGVGGRGLGNTRITVLSASY
ncbi:hypothetical protein JRQ81_000500 [Phrynocephalus forsythii]|uniref:Reverse transcriptase domain-containing protein n=1 Tax=Phrynocephalus forsythii TaxID=171643 RepID=A0A9Q1B803_9SAUR|nr:hypothetical protein JRQ81_000500 [Phrynocephalus forsythii]